MKDKAFRLPRSVLMSLLFVASAFTTAAKAAQCEHVVLNHWNSGFVAEIRITNDTSNPIYGWEVSWAYDDAVRTNGWNANVSGANPYTATPLSWNSTVQPGQTVAFGVQGNKFVMNGPAPTAVVTGPVCGEPDTDSDGVFDKDDLCPNTPAGTVVDANGCKVIFDADQDGVEDHLDQCPNTPAGDNVDALGCTILPDDDNDGVPNISDQCPNTPLGTPVDSIGCALPDDDNDGVANGVDQCPNTPAGTVVDADGCEAQGMYRVNSTGKVTKNGQILPMQCGSWFGLEGQHEPKDAQYNADGAPMELFSGNMWWANNGQGTGRTVQQTMTEIKNLGINVIRLPIAPQTLDPTDPQGIGFQQAGGVLKNHESVRQTNARQAMEDFIKLADQNDLHVIVDIHSCSNYIGWRAGRLDATPPYVDADRVGYEFTREEYSCGPAGPGVTVHEYNETIWLDNLREIAGLQDELGVDNIVGIDIFNEPWDYTWAEWKDLSEKAYQAISEVNSDMLIVVEGIGSVKSDGTEIPHGDMSTNPNWGENLYEFQSSPLDIPKNRLILSPHTYGPSVFVQNHFLDPAQTQCEGLEGDAAGNANCNIIINPSVLEAGWEEHFGYLRDQGYALLIGEFGGNMEWPNNTRPAEKQMWSHITPGVDQEWQDALVDYMVKEDIEGCYWSINPESGDTGGLYEHAYEPVVNESDWGRWLEFNPEKTSLLQILWGSN